MLLSAWLVLVLPAVVSSRVLHARQTVVCSYETPAGSGDTCQSLSSEWGLTISQFVALNPGVNCPGNLVNGQNYCVVGTVTSAAPTSTTTSPDQTPTTKSTSTAITTSATSGGHLPQQSGLAANCNRFYQVAAGDSCSVIESKYDISGIEFYSWNPSINSQCTNLLLGYYVCVGVPGATSTPAAPATTTPSNGVSTPTPVQAGITSNCNRFYVVHSGDTCSSITSKYDISLANFYSWNPAVGNSCGSLWLGYNVCIGIIGQSTGPSKTTKAGNGIATPTPVQTGMTTNCDEFRQVQTGDTCASIASVNGIPLSQFYSWNPAVGSSCSALWLGYYVCVDALGYNKPTTKTTAGNGIPTPTPYEPGMVGDCNSFYYVESGDSCDTIAATKHISVSELEAWNPKIGSSCSDLWLHTYICVGVK